MGNQRKVLELNPDERNAWLNVHLPNRVGAAWIWLSGLKAEWAWLSHRDFAEDADSNQVWCIGRAAEQGQKAAMRWLIEFVGIALSGKKRKEDKGTPCRPREYDSNTDVSIQSFAAVGSDLEIKLRTEDLADESSKAWILAKVWNGCSQSCVHATLNTNHYRADPPELAEAFMIIVEHLDSKLYVPAGGNRLSEIVKGLH